MGEAEQGRGADEHVEPLFAGLRAADSVREREPGTGEPSRSDPWKHSAHAQPSPALEPDLAAEPSSVRLFIKALVLVIALIAIAAAVYFVFGV